MPRIAKDPSQRWIGHNRARNEYNLTLTNDRRSGPHWSSHAYCPCSGRLLVPLPGVLMPLEYEAPQCPGDMPWAYLSRGKKAVDTFPLTPVISRTSGTYSFGDVLLKVISADAAIARPLRSNLRSSWETAIPFCNRDEPDAKGSKCPML